MTAGLWVLRRGDSERSAEHAFLAAASLMFAASTTLTIVWCAPMSAMGGMLMPGGWTMSMVWMRTPGQTWAGAAASLLGMWIVMMVAMMLPALIPMVWRYRQAFISAHEARLGLLTALVGMGYFWVSTLVGMVLIPLGLALAEAEMQHPALSRLVPIAAAVIVMLAGASQFTAWKAHHLACCLAEAASGRGGGTLPANAGTAWRHGMRLGVHCSCCSAGLTTILLVMGVMDLGVMALVTTAMTAERFAPDGERVARVIGVLVVCAGVLRLAHAAGLQ